MLPTAVITAATAVSTPGNDVQKRRNPLVEAVSFALVEAVSVMMSPRGRVRGSLGADPGADPAQVRSFTRLDFPTVKPLGRFSAVTRIFTTAARTRGRTAVRRGRSP